MLNNHVVVGLGSLFARRTDRRTLLGRVSRGTFAAAASLALGAGMAIPAYADCSCSYPNNNACSDCPNVGGCSNFCSFCTEGQNPLCPWPTGYWTVQCNGCFIYCSDCNCGGSICGCTSACIPSAPSR